MERKKKILIITPRSPFTNTGACEQDRLSGIEWFVRNGYDVRVITKAFESDAQSINEYKEKLNICITPIPYAYRARKGFLKYWTFFKRLCWPLYWDGASFEYFDSYTQTVVKEAVESFNPDYVWFDYSYLWPLYHICEKRKIPIITRSINFEPIHFLDEDGRTFLNRIRSLPKYMSEYLSFSRSNYFFSITPKEEVMYKRFGKTPVKTLPLRSLPGRVEIPRNKVFHDGIRIGFMPSTYNVHHNREALRFLVEDVIPSLPDQIKGQVTLHVTGSKFPKEFEGNMPPQIIYEGFVPSVITFWQNMDIAVSPSLFGAGMQQKIFEPISLGVPTITAQRGLAGYPFINKEMVLCAETKKETVKAITDLVSDPQKTLELGTKGKKRAEEIFSQDTIDSLIRDALSRIYHIT